MPDLAPLAAFGRTEARRQRFGSLILSETASLGLASLAIARDAPSPELKGLRLPGPGAWAEGPALSAFWIAPNQWMIEVPGGAESDIAHDLRAALPDAAVTEQTDGWVILDITSETGPRPLDRCLEKLINLDLDRFGPGSATRTGLGHMSVFVIRRSQTVVTVIGMRSAAGSLWHALEEASARVAAGSP